MAKREDMTDAEVVLFKEMRPRDLEFAKDIAAGMEQLPAYEKRMKRGPMSSDKINASKLVHKKQIAGYIRFILRASEKQAILNRVGLINIVADAIDEAVKTKNLKMIFVGAKRLCDMEGWDAAKKYEHSGPDGAPITTIERLIVDPKKPNADSNS